MEDRLCERCHINMLYRGRQKLVNAGPFGITPDIAAGDALDIYVCPECRKLEFVQLSAATRTQGVPGRRCPRCGQTHDFDDPKCPLCGFDYYGKER